MFILKSIYRVKKVEKIILFKYVNKRFQSTECATLNKDTEGITRKYSKPLFTEQTKQNLKDNFLQSLYAGVVDKSIFEYPAVLRETDLDIVINHSAEVEKFLQGTSNNKLSEDTINNLRKLELFGLSMPQKYGGAGYNETEYTFLQECTGSNPTIGRFLGYNENFGCKILNLYGTEEQKEKYLPRLAQGKSFISLAYLENGPLIDFSKIEGYALNDELNKTHILTAEKKWVHNADKADLFLVMVKLAKFLDSDAEVQVKFNFYIVERGTPGLTVHKLKSTYAQENHLFDVSLKDVALQHENLLGDVETDGFVILKTALSHNNLTDAALCCNLIKHISQEAVQFIGKNELQNTSVRGYGLMHENLASLVVHLYALESVIYLVTGRYDTYKSPDLFNESVFAKTLALDILKIAIKKYTEILGRESFKSEILEEAIKTVQYYSVYDENIEYLKMMSSADGIVYAGKKLSQKVKRLRNPFDNNLEVFKWNFIGSRSEKSKQNFKLELQETLSIVADILEETFLEFQSTLENYFCQHGRLIIDNEHIIVKFGEMAAYIYAAIACLSRASSSICYNLPDHQNESLLAQAFTHIAHAKVKELCAQEVQYTNINQCYVDLGKEVLSRKEYPVEHPLARTY